MDLVGPGHDLEVLAVVRAGVLLVEVGLVLHVLEDLAEERLLLLAVLEKQTKNLKYLWSNTRPMH